MASINTFDCFIKVIIWSILIFDCFIRVTCICLTVLIEYFDLTVFQKPQKTGWIGSWIITTIIILHSKLSGL